ncbi:MAG TPA: class I SAM-dependent methyltransferase [Thermoanaerobaculia bacterium]|jgi:SAM-dependent methyltransferase
MDALSDEIHRQVADYYSRKFHEHGATARGVDWKSAESQYNRFRQLARVIERTPFSILDVGCGYGAFADFLRETHAEFRYVGTDISEDMAAAAAERHRHDPRVVIAGSLEDAPVCDYVVASGIFNVRLSTPDAEWWSYILGVLQTMSAKSRHGLAANFLTSYSDPEYMRDDLYYADPRAVFDWAKRNLSKQVALLHDYGLYEFTLLVRKVLE